MIALISLDQRMRLGQTKLTLSCPQPCELVPPPSVAAEERIGSSNIVFVSAASARSGNHEVLAPSAVPSSMICQLQVYICAVPCAIEPIGAFCHWESAIGYMFVILSVNQFLTFLHQTHCMILLKESSFVRFYLPLTDLHTAEKICSKTGQGFHD